MRIRTVALAVAALVLGGSSSSAGLYFLPPADVRALVSWDSSAVVFFRTSNPYVRSLHSGLYVMTPDGSGTRQLPVTVGSQFALSSRWHWLADIRGTTIIVQRPDGSELRTLTADDSVTHVSFSHDESRLVYSTIRSMWTTTVDGGARTRIADAGENAEWSPVADLIAYSLAGTVRVVGSDGSAPRVLTDSVRSTTELRWSPDGGRLAFVTANDQLGVVDLGDRHITTYAPPARPVGFAWSPDGSQLAYLTVGGSYVITPATRKQRRVSSLRFTSGLGTAEVELSWSPNGRWLFFSSNGACHDRVGVYRVDVAATRTARVSNRCLIRGTAHRDVLSGTELYDVIVGAGGNDLLGAVDGNYQGDDLSGGPGNDRLAGAEWNNVLDGGPGNDRLDGGIRDDKLDGGPGRDVLDGGPGKDTLHARDGTRDVVDCGTNTPGNPERLDVAHVDRIDVVRGCERVVRR